MSYAKDDEAELDESASSPLWPSAADGTSGLRDRRTPSWSEDATRITDPYELISPIGATAYGRAFRARHSAQQREVAVHFLSLVEDGEGTLASTLPLAVAKCAQLSHPNVIAIEEHGRDDSDDTYFLVTEPLEGASLADYLDDVGTLPLARVLSITLQVGRALRAAHKLGIVHGALTPANVRLVKTDHGDIARVLGFASATFAPRAQRGGEPRNPYEAPELARGAQPDVRSDVFAVGGLLYRMLSGQPPPAIAEGAPPSLSLQCSEPIPRALDELVTRCLEPRPEVRLVDVVALTRELREIARRVNAGIAGETALLVHEDSLAPRVPASGDGESSGSLLAADAALRRSGAIWILAGLVVALAVVWLV